MYVQDEIGTVRRLLKQCEADRETEVSRRQQAEEQLRQVLEANRMLTAQLESGRQSAAAQQQVIAFSSVFHTPQVSQLRHTDTIRATRLQLLGSEVWLRPGFVPDVRSRNDG